MAEKEKNAEELGVKSKADPTFYISMVGADENGIVDEHEHIFDLYTKAYDFVGSDVHVISAQDLWNFYESKNKGLKLFNRFTLVEGAKRDWFDIYFLVEYFIQHHPNGHFVLDECPFLKQGRYRKY